jgi:hypothetical protein
VKLLVRGSAGDGSPTFSPLPLNAAGQADFPLSLAFINANLGLIVNITYLLIRGDAQATSRPLDLRVLRRAQAPIITSIEAGGVFLEPGDSTYYRTGFVIIGSAEPNQPVEVMDGISTLGRYTSNGDGIWTMPAGRFTPTGHSITAKTVDGSNLTSPTFSFGVLEGLQYHIASFHYQDAGGWVWGGAGRVTDLAWVIHPVGTYWALHNQTYTNQSNGNVLVRTFTDLTPGATYLLASSMFRSNTPFAHPQLQLGTSSGVFSGIYTLSIVHQIVPLRLQFVATTPTMQLMLINHQASGVGNDWHMEYIDLNRLALP